MSENEDRTQAPSKRRIDEARERGQVAQSPELTAAAGLLGAALVLYTRGDALGSALLSLFREPMLVTADAEAVVARLRGLALVLAWPLLEVLAGFLGGAVAAHQAQVRGLWAPSLLAPDAARLWGLSQAADPGSRARKGVWALIRAVVVAAVAVWLVRSAWPGLQQLGRLDTPGLALTAAQTVRHSVLTLAAATLALGLVDFALQHQRFQALMRLTPEQSREDLRSVEGDPALRARRRRLAQAMTGQDLAGASLVVTGQGGLTVVVAGGPPPNVVSVRALANGQAGDRLRRDALTVRLYLVDSPTLARQLAHRRPAGQPFPPGLLEELALIWPNSQEPLPKGLS